MQVTLFLCGDVMIGRGVDQILPCPSPPHLREVALSSAADYVALAERANGPIPRPVDWGYVWGVVPEVLRRKRPHARIINLETSITTSEKAAPKGINYRMHPANAAVLEAAEIDCCVLANNHVLDWGVDGLLETLTTLRQRGMRFAGAGENLAAAQAPAVLDIGSAGRVLVFAVGATDAGIPPSWAAGSATPGVHLLPDFSERTVEYFAQLVDASKQLDDIAVASVHWGANWGFAVPRAHHHFAHALIDRARIDVVHGHSSHHPRAIEVYRGRPIFYGCGDFLNDYEGIPGHEHFRGDLVLMYVPTLESRTGALVRLEMTPLQIRNFRLRSAEREDRILLRSLLDRECRRFGHQVVCRDDAYALVWP
ncbi:MAG TPA: CapA family protein [Gemmatimonadaceae bacterium]|nr:CapA family protein [Gemmatimonadaceae bacterium]